MPGEAPFAADFDPVNRLFFIQYTADVHAQLGEATFEAARNEGQALTLEQALVYALEET